MSKKNKNTEEPEILPPSNTPSNVQSWNHQISSNEGLDSNIEKRISRLINGNIAFTEAHVDNTIKEQAIREANQLSQWAGSISDEHRNLAKQNKNER